ncbi:hypothetical protein BDV93DRAFT_609628 [Ceratobasidium sp. AG-I]|nr:hypothetical protein BDV93DRAFT_609628 [Ceratobasidium sp. AG-I]
MSSARHISDIPELIGAIAALLSDRRPFLLASKRLFYSVAPLIWKSVPRVDLLLQLIPGTRVLRNSSNRDAYLILVDITLPSRLDLTRFEIYAPWVRHLEVFNGEYKYILNNADALFHLASTRPVLPNLHVLTLTLITLDEISDAEYLYFTELFLSPTLAEIRHVGLSNTPPYLKIRSVPRLIQKILNVCPSIEVLGFYPGEEPAGDYTSSRNVNFSLPDASLHADLARFSNLRSFTSTLYIFEPATLWALGSLPLLESLDVFDCAEDLGSLDVGLTIPDDLFPSLRHLCLRNFDAKDVSTVWNQPLVRNLESVTIKCDPSPVEEDFDTMAGQDWVDAFLTKLPRTSPHISKLELDFEGVPSLGLWTYSLTRAGIDALSQLPLHIIRLYFISAPYEDLVPALPGLEEFYHMDVQIEIEQLRMFATHMPKLRSLTVDVYWSAYVPWEAEFPNTMSSPLPIVLTSRFDLADFELPVPEFRKMARFLAELWPGGFRGETYSRSWESRDKANIEKLDQLNELVAGYLAEAAFAARSASANGQM